MSAIKTILRLFFVCGKDVYDIYRTRFQIEFCFRDGHQFTGLLDCQARDEKARTRFQIEFCFRDGHQFTGLLDCQARDEKALDFACNASLAAVNITKALRKQTNVVR